MVLVVMLVLLLLLVLPLLLCLLLLLLLLVVVVDDGVRVKTVLFKPVVTQTRKEWKEGPPQKQRSFYAFERPLVAQLYDCPPPASATARQGRLQSLWHAIPQGVLAYLSCG